MDRYWTFENGQLQGPYEPEALVKLPNFTPDTSLCKVGDGEWRTARDVQSVRRVLPAQVLAGPNWTPSRPVARVRQVVLAGDYKKIVIKESSQKVPSYRAPASGSASARKKPSFARRLLHLTLFTGIILGMAGISPNGYQAAFRRLLHDIVQQVTTLYSGVRH